MKNTNLKNIFYSVLNVSVIAAIIVFIIVGLWKIGLLESPAFIKNWFFSEKVNHSENSEKIEDFLSENPVNNRYDVTAVQLSSENVKKILSEIQQDKTYSHDFQYSLISSHKIVTKRITVIKENGIACAYFVSHDGSVNKQIIEHDGTTTVNTLFNNELKTETFNSGDIEFSEQIGAVISHKDFLEAADNSDYSFSLASSEDGTVMIIEFNSSIGEYTQKQNYKLNLDYGVVIEAKCYENDTLIYSLTTNSLSSSAVTELNIPSVFLDSLPDDSKLSKTITELQE